jgi:dTDP-glucose 4,6-dehydratase
VQGDIGDFDLVSRLLAEHQPRAVVNFAAESHVDRSIHGPGEFIQTNIVGTFQLLEAVRAYWGGLPDGQARGLPLPARLHRRSLRLARQGPTRPSPKPPLRAQQPVLGSKAASDHLVRAYHHTYGLPVLTTNCSNNYGPYHFPKS